MAQAAFSLGDFAVRWLAALALVFVTFNPTNYSYLDWLTTNWPGDDLPLKALAGVVLLILYVIFLRSTLRSIGAFGLVLAALLCGAIVWVLIDYGWIDPTQAGVITWVILVVIATILAIGVSWSHLRRQISGQVDVDDVDDR